MKVDVVKANLVELNLDAIGIGLFEDKELPERIKAVDKALNGAISEIIKSKKFEPKDGKTFVLSTLGNINSQFIILIGLGKYEQYSHETARRFGSRVIKKANELNFKNVGVELLDGDKIDIKTISRAIVEGAIMGEYKFTEYKTEKEDKQVESLSVIVKDDNMVDAAKEGSKIGQIFAESVNYVRDLGNHPANVMTPTRLANEAKKLATKYGLNIKVFSLEEAKNMGMNAFYAVAKGSNEPAKFIVLEYNMDQEKYPLYAIVGKGITFDSGGLSLKTSEGMTNMKYDMLGAASVLGITRIVAELKLPIRLIAVIPATENMPSGTATKPGDVVKSYSGVTIEILNTDAEGRLILADALGYVSKNYKPKAIIDLATLTGACVIALGHTAIGLFSKDDDLAEKLIKAGEKTWDRAWRLPLWDDYYELLKSDIADVKNVGGRPAGAITAAAFLSKFLVGDPKPKWAHLDIAGAGMTDSAKEYIPKGASGAGVRLVAQYLVDEVT